jgi:hypothetical protein
MKRKPIALAILFVTLAIECVFIGTHLELLKGDGFIVVFVGMSVINFPLIFGIRYYLQKKP